MTSRSNLKQIAREFDFAAGKKNGTSPASPPLHQLPSRRWPLGERLTSPPYGHGPRNVDDVALEPRHDKLHATCQIACLTAARRSSATVRLPSPLRRQASPRSAHADRRASGVAVYRIGRYNNAPGRRHVPKMRYSRFSLRVSFLRS